MNFHTELQQQVNMLNEIKNEITHGFIIHKENFLTAHVSSKLLRKICSFYRITPSKSKRDTIQTIIHYESDPENIYNIYSCRKFIQAYIQ